MFGLDVAMVNKTLGEHSTEICRHFDHMEGQLHDIYRLLVAIELNTRPVEIKLEDRNAG